MADKKLIIPMFKIQAKPNTSYLGIRGLEKRTGSVRRVTICEESVVSKLLLKRDCVLIPLNEVSLKLVETTLKKSRLFSDKTARPVFEAAKKAYEITIESAGKKGKPVVKRIDSSRKGNSSRQDSSNKNTTDKAVVTK